MDKDLNNYTSSNHGFVYILSNPTMPGLLKIGMTRFDPSRRVQELSSATGVPTPFNLVYYREFSNCVVAETEIHSILASKGLRYNNQREFFQLILLQQLTLYFHYQINQVKNNTLNRFVLKILIKMLIGLSLRKICMRLK